MHRSVKQVFILSHVDQSDCFILDRYIVCLQAVYQLEDIQKRAIEVGYFLKSTSISCDMMVRDLNDLVSLFLCDLISHKIIVQTCTFKSIGTSSLHSSK